MKLWELLLAKKKTEKAASRTPLQEEMAWIERLSVPSLEDKIRAEKQRRKPDIEAGIQKEQWAYCRTLPPFVGASVKQHLRKRWGLKPEEGTDDAKDMEAAWRYFEYLDSFDRLYTFKNVTPNEVWIERMRTEEQRLTAAQKHLVEQYRENYTELIRQRSEALNQLHQIQEEHEKKLKKLVRELKEKDEQAWEGYWRHYETLDADLQKQIGYELAKRGCSSGMSGFHGGCSQPALPFPFQMCGWASYTHPEYG